MILPNGPGRNEFPWSFALHRKFEWGCGPKPNHHTFRSFEYPMENCHRTQMSILEQFLNDPRTTTLKSVHLTSIHQAVLVKRGKILAVANNRIGSRKRGCGYSEFTIHAEKNVVKSLGDISKLRGCDMYVMRFCRDAKKEGVDRFMNSAPCSTCRLFLEKCMREYGLKNVYYTQPESKCEDTGCHSRAHHGAGGSLGHGGSRGAPGPSPASRGFGSPQECCSS